MEANIDAVLAGAPGNTERQNAPGILVAAGSNRNIILCNLVVRNWRAAITNSTIIGAGFRVGAAGNAPDVDPPMPGDGLSVEDLNRSGIAGGSIP